jgi:hypothetical protein
MVAIVVVGVVGVVVAVAVVASDGNGMNLRRSFRHNSQVCEAR